MLEKSSKATQPTIAKLLVDSLPKNKTGRNERKAAYTVKEKVMSFLLRRVPEINRLADGTRHVPNQPEQSYDSDHPSSQT